MAKTAKVKPLSTFDNPSVDDYAKARDLRPTFELDADELRIWDEIMPWLAMNGRLQPWYKHTLMEYCRIVANIGKIIQYFRDNPGKEYYTVAGRNGEQKKADPRVAQLNDNRRILFQVVREFGLTPSSERQMTVIQDDLINIFAEHDRSTR